MRELLEHDGPEARRPPRPVPVQHERDAGRSPDAVHRETSYVLVPAATIPQRRLPNGALALSELSLGCAQLGNLYREVTDAEAQATVDAAWELGVRYFDTAPHYGLGLSERRLGAALWRRVPARST